MITMMMMMIIVIMMMITTMIMIQVLLFTLQSKMRANNKEPYTPREGKMIRDINTAWERLEKVRLNKQAFLRNNNFPNNCPIWQVFQLFPILKIFQLS